MMGIRETHQDGARAEIMQLSPFHGANQNPLVRSVEKPLLSFESIVDRQAEGSRKTHQHLPKLSMGMKSARLTFLADYTIDTLNLERDMLLAFDHNELATMVDR